MDATSTIYSGHPKQSGVLTEYYIPPLTAKQREYLRLIYLGGIEACPSEPGRCKVVDSLVKAGMLGARGLSDIGQQVGRGIAQGVF